MSKDKVTVSRRYQITIPKWVRERVPVHPGQEFGLLLKGDIISLVPIPTLDELYGVLEGASVEGIRDEEDRF
jgi:AbrB family looped-hinge helix DNA binding protein